MRKFEVSSPDDIHAWLNTLSDLAQENEQEVLEIEELIGCFKYNKTYTIYLTLQIYI